MVAEWMHCLDCSKKWNNTGADQCCPHCGSDKIEVFGDEEDIDATSNEYTDQFNRQGVKKDTIGMGGMKEKRSDFDPSNRGEVEELQPDPNWNPDMSGIPDILTSDT